MALPNKVYKAKKYTGDSSLTHLVKASYGKKLLFECTIKDDKRVFAFTLRNKNDEIVFEAKVQEKDILELAKTLTLSSEMFKVRVYDRD